MSRKLRIAAAQLGPVNLADSRASVVKRLVAMLREAASMGAKFVVFPELAFTTFFPRYWYEDEKEAEKKFFEASMPSPETQPLFDEAKKHGIGFYIGYAELTEEEGKPHRYNTAILVSPEGTIVGKYRKIHLPGHADHKTGAAFQLLGLQGAEIVTLGFNTPTENLHYPEPPALRVHHHLIMAQSMAFQNAVWLVEVAKCGFEDGFRMFGHSVIVSPSGEIVAKTSSEEDEVIAHTVDLALGENLRKTMFNLAAHRRPEHYKLIVERTGVEITPAN